MSNDTHSRAELYLGLISGTSADGIDVALVDCAEERVRLLKGITISLAPTLRQQVLALSQGDGSYDIDQYGRLDVQLGEAFAAAALALLGIAGVAPEAIRAIGSHGQTVRHRPLGTHPFTLQLGDASIIAERTGIPTVADFRRADVAAGGQGAPLLPILHARLLATRDEPCAVLNLGGIANLTVLGDANGIRGFDSGPANALLDAWCQLHTGQPVDSGGVLAAQGRPDRDLLNTLLRDPYFGAPPPKSTGREYFHLRWLDDHLRGRDIAVADVQATLLALTVQSVVQALAEHAPSTRLLWVCGGGVHNRHLMEALKAALPFPVRSTADVGIDPDFIEAMAFAWLAKARLQGIPGNVPSVTGARGTRVLGAVYSTTPSF